jgi:hypothetical protein
VISSCWKWRDLMHVCVAERKTAGFVGFFRTQNFDCNRCAYYWFRLLIKTLGENKTNCFPRDQTLSV